MISAFVHGTVASLPAAIYVLTLDVLFVCTFFAKLSVAGVTANGASTDDQLATWGSVTFPLVGLLDWWPAAQLEMTEVEVWTMRCCFAVSAAWWATLTYYWVERSDAHKHRGVSSNAPCLAGLVVVLLVVWTLTMQIVSAAMLANGYESCMAEQFPQPGPCWTVPESPWNYRPAIKRSCGANHHALAASHFFGWAGGFGAIKPLIEFHHYSELCNSSSTFVATPYFISFFWASVWAVIYLLIIYNLLREVPALLAGMVAPPTTTPAPASPPRKIALLPTPSITAVV
jgi:hypothetical protein